MMRYALQGSWLAALSLTAVADPALAQTRSPDRPSPSILQTDRAASPTRGPDFDTIDAARAGADVIRRQERMSFAGATPMRAQPSRAR